MSLLDWFKGLASRLGSGAEDVPDPLVPVAITELEQDEREAREGDEA